MDIPLPGVSADELTVHVFCSAYTKHLPIANVRKMTLFMVVRGRTVNCGILKYHSITMAVDPTPKPVCDRRMKPES